MPEAATATETQAQTADQDIDFEIIEIKDGEQPPTPGNENIDPADVAANDDARAEGQADDDDPDAIKRERRQLTRERTRLARDRDRVAVDLMRREYEAMAARLAQIEGQQNAQTLYTVTTRLEQAQAYKRQADMAFAEAAAKGDVQGAYLARQHQEAADVAARELAEAERRLKSLPPPRPVQAPIDPRAARRAQAWASEHPWFDPSGADPDSRMALALDHKLVAEEGSDNTSEEHYRELDRRLAAALPNRYAARNGNGAANDNPNRRRDMPTSTPSETASPGKVQYYLTPGRKAAMKASGLDVADLANPNAPKEKKAEIKKMLAYYQEYDRQNAATRR